MDYLKIYQSLGVSIEAPKGGSIQAVGTCPFCGRHKFSINIRDGRGHCWACPVLLKIQNKEGFNLVSFIRLLWEQAFNDGKGLSIISSEKNIPITELIRWGFRYSKTGKIILPGYDIAGRIIQLYVWQTIKGKNRMIGTESLPAALMYLPKESKVNPLYICEGIWDAIVLRSHLDKGTTLAIPGASIFKDEWLPFFSNREVFICLDNDLAGRQGSQKLLSKLYPVCRNVRVLVWPGKFPEGYDIRDYLSDNTFDHTKFIKLFSKQIPSLIRRTSSFQSVINQWKEAISWSETLSDVLAILLAVCVSTFIKGDQIWLRLIGAPSSGKTTFCEALGLLKEYVTIISTMTGFYSGWLGNDSSLVQKLTNKILITKDADTLLQSPNLRQILSEARDIYDGYGRAVYRNTVDREYSSIRITWILAGTSLIATLGDRELGERFLNVTTYRMLPEVIEAQLAYKKIEQVIDQVNRQDQERPESLQKAMMLTAGYLKDLIEASERPEYKLKTEDQIHIYHLAALIARLRARPSKVQNEFIEREIATRLCSQLTKLLYCLMIVFKVKEPDESCWRCLKKVAIDTSDGTSLQLIEFLYNKDEATYSEIVQEVISCKRSLLDYLTSIGVLKREKKKAFVWKLNEDFRELYEMTVKES